MRIVALFTIFSPAAIPAVHIEEVDENDIAFPLTDLQRLSAENQRIQASEEQRLQALLEELLHSFEALHASAPFGLQPNNMEARSNPTEEAGKDGGLHQPASVAQSGSTTGPAGGDSKAVSDASATHGRKIVTVLGLAAVAMYSFRASDKNCRAQKAGERSILCRLVVYVNDGVKKVSERIINPFRG
jgi:hypothetical protein